MNLSKAQELLQASICRNNSHHVKVDRHAAAAILMVATEPARKIEELLKLHQDAKQEAHFAKKTVEVRDAEIAELKLLLEQREAEIVDLNRTIARAVAIAGAVADNAEVEQTQMA